MTCSRCAPFIGKGQRVLARGVYADEPKCAFRADGMWDDANWDCQTLALFRSHPFGVETGSEDQTILVVPFAGEFVVLGFYKHRHHVETGVFISEDQQAPLNLATAERMLAKGRA